jgi:hypothetical protein
VFSLLASNLAAQDKHSSCLANSVHFTPLTQFPNPVCSSPQLEGTWEFLWAGARSPGLAAARRILGLFPGQVASIDSLTLNIFGNKSKAVATVKALSSLVYKVTIVSSLFVEGNSRSVRRFVLPFLCFVRLALCSSPLAKSLGVAFKAPYKLKQVSNF